SSTSAAWSAKSTPCSRRPGPTVSMKPRSAVSPAWRKAWTSVGTSCVSGGPGGTRVSTPTRPRHGTPTRSSTTASDLGGLPSGGCPASVAVAARRVPQPQAAEDRAGIADQGGLLPQVDLEVLGVAPADLEPVVQHEGVEGLDRHRHPPAPPLVAD